MKCLTVKLMARTYTYRPRSTGYPFRSVRHLSPSPIRSRGSALTELAGLSSILLALMFGVPMIGNLVDLKQTAVQAGRYAAWEATVNDASSTHAPAHVGTRFFGDPDTSIVSAPSDAGDHHLWGDVQARRGLARDTEVRIDGSAVAAHRYESVAADGMVSIGLGETVVRAGQMLPSGGDDRWDLTANGLTRGGVSVEIRGNDWTRGFLSSCGDSSTWGCLDERSIIMADGWNAGSDDQAARRVRSLVPASVLEPVGNALSALGVVPIFDELDGLKDAFGHVDVTRLPSYVEDE